MAFASLYKMASSEADFCRTLWRSKRPYGCHWTNRLTVRGPGCLDLYLVVGACTHLVFCCFLGQNVKGKQAQTGYIGCVAKQPKDGTSDLHQGIWEVVFILHFQGLWKPGRPFLVCQWLFFGKIWNAKSRDEASFLNFVLQKEKLKIIKVMKLIGHYLVKFWKQPICQDTSNHWRPPPVARPSGTGSLKGMVGEGFKDPKFHQKFHGAKWCKMVFKIEDKHLAWGRSVLGPGLAIVFLMSWTFPQKNGGERLW